MEVEPIRREEKGAKLIKRLQSDAEGCLEELLPLFAARVEATDGEVGQTIKLSIKFKPGNGEERPDVFEIFANLGTRTGSVKRVVRIRHTPKGAQLSLFADPAPGEEPAELH